MKVSANTQWKLKHVKMSKGFTFSEVDISLLSLLHTVKTTHRFVANIDFNPGQGQARGFMEISLTFANFLK